MITITKALAELERQCEEVRHQKITVKDEIRENDKQLHEVIDHRQNQLIGQLNQINENSLAAQKVKIESLQAQLSSCVQFVKENLETSFELWEVLVMKRNKPKS